MPPRRSTSRLAAALATLLALVAAAPASALTVSRTTTVAGTTLTITGEAGVNNVIVTQPWPGAVEVKDVGAVPYDAVYSLWSALTVRASLGGGDDAFAAAFGVLDVHGDAGNDTIAGDKTPGGTLSGDDGDDTFFPVLGAAAAPVAVTIAGGAGRDTVSFDNVAVPVVARLGGTAGEVTIGSDVEGLIGGSAGDTLSGSTGADTIQGGPGADTIEDADGVADAVDCGEGTDAVHADSLDALTGCESLDLKAIAAPVAPAPTVPDAPAAPAPAATPPAPTAPAPPQLALGPVTLTLPSAVVLGARTSAMPLTVGCAAGPGARCRGSVRLTVALGSAAKGKASAARAHRRVVTLARGRFSVGRGRSAKVSAKVWRRGVRQALDDAKQRGAAKPKGLRGKQVLAAKVRGTVTVTTTGADGKVRRATRRVSVDVSGSRTG